MDDIVKDMLEVKQIANQIKDAPNQETLQFLWLRLERIKQRCEEDIKRLDLELTKLE